MGGNNNTIDLIELLATIDCSVGIVNDNKKVKNQNEKLVRKVDDKTNKPTSKIGQTSKTHTACFGDKHKHTHWLQFTIASVRLRIPFLVTFAEYLDVAQPSCC